MTMTKDRAESLASLDNLDISAKVQHCGLLLKRPFGHPSSRWQKRFFIIKEGFLLYYAEAEKKNFERRRQFNIHPKGVIPLGDCTIQPAEEAGQPFAIHINHEDFSQTVALATDSELDRDKWVEILQSSGRVTWKNAQLGEAMIQTLEQQGLQMAKEKQEYINQIHTQVHELCSEREEKEELERITKELEEEKKKVEKVAEQLSMEQENVRTELDQTVEALKAIEEEKQSLHTTTSDLQHSLQKLADENTSLAKTTNSFKGTLKDIEDKMRSIEQEKEEAAQRLLEKEELARQLEREKDSYSAQAQELQSSLDDLSAQKEMTESELREEVVARLNTEKRLRQAEDALERLDLALRDLISEQKASNGNRSSQMVADVGSLKTTFRTLEAQQALDRLEVTVAECALQCNDLMNLECQCQIIADIATIRQFFEECAQEAKVDADKPVIMKNALHARKNYVRKAATIRFKRTKSTSSASAPSSRQKGLFSPCSARRTARMVNSDPQLRHSMIGTLAEVERDLQVMYKDQV
ncbi:Pleckstrin y domain containing, D (with coiled-coil domains) member 1 [Branchiostoma belcheri]|nr:Pleckstrin y domain containing, D (with coiled-coil domains) member 1 [Branchiostoma belcheri]